MKVLVLHIVLLILLPYGSFAQEEEWRVIPSITEWIEEVNNWPEEEYIQSYIKIRFNADKDLGLFIRSFEEQGNFIPAKDRVAIEKPVTIYDLDFVGNETEAYLGRWLTNIHFKEEFSFYRVRDSRVGFMNCVFDKLFQPRVMDSRFWLRFVDCHFKGRVYCNNPTKPTTIRLRRCKVDSMLVFSANDATPSLEIFNSEIYGLAVSDKMNDILIRDTKFEQGLKFNNLMVNRSFRLIDSKYEGLDLSGTSLPVINSYIPFKEATGKLKVDLFNWNDGIRQTDGVANAYSAKTEAELKDKASFDELIANYYKLLGVYKARGEMDSYNACYVEMRDKVTARSKLLYTQEPTFNMYFDYQINRFTRAFSDYGTRPAKALLIFFQVVLAFSIFYFFFPSSWNTTNSSKLMKRLSYLGSYFKSEEGLADLFEKEYREEYKDYEEFRSFMSTSQKELPVYFKWLSKPLYNLSTSRFNLTRSILKKSDILNGKWTELPPGKKASTSIIIGLYITLYLLYVLLIRCLNAITLSLNSFSTLGFGEIPTKGMARYITIIQGFVGWFLLSIFLVSLIGQILN